MKRPPIGVLAVFLAVVRRAYLSQVANTEQKET